MDKDEKLLYLDLCSRLPFHNTVMRNETTGEDINIQYFANMTSCKPYLYPITVLTEDKLEELLMEAEEYAETHSNENLSSEFIMSAWMIDYMNGNNIDWRGLIPKGLAIEVPKDGFDPYRHFGDMKTVVTVEQKGKFL